MRYLVTGAGGQLGSHLAERLRAGGADFSAPTRDDLDITSPAQVDTVIAQLRPDVVINAAAYCGYLGAN